MLIPHLFYKKYYKMPRTEKIRPGIVLHPAGGR